MKLPKRVYLGIAILLFLSGSVATLTLMPRSTTKTLEVKQTSASAPVAEGAPVAEPQVTQPLVAPQNPVDEPTQEAVSVPTKSKQHFVDSALSGTYNPEEQWACFDNIVKETIGYNTYEDAVERMDAIKNTGNSFCGAYINYVKNKDYAAPGHKEVIDKWVWPSLSEGN